MATNKYFDIMANRYATLQPNDDVNAQGSNLYNMFQAIGYVLNDLYVENAIQNNAQSINNCYGESLDNKVAQLGLPPRLQATYPKGQITLIVPAVTTAIPNMIVQANAPIYSDVGLTTQIGTLVNLPTNTTFTTGTVILNFQLSAIGFYANNLPSVYLAYTTTTSTTPTAINCVVTSFINGNQYYNDADFLSYSLQQIPNISQNYNYGYYINSALKVNGITDALPVNNNGASTGAPYFGTSIVLVILSGDTALTTLEPYLVPNGTNYQEFSRCIYLINGYYANALQPIFYQGDSYAICSSATYTYTNPTTDGQLGINIYMLSQYTSSSIVNTSIGSYTVSVLVIAIIRMFFLTRSIYGNSSISAQYNDGIPCQGFYAYELDEYLNKQLGSIGVIAQIIKQSSTVVLKTFINSHTPTIITPNDVAILQYGWANNTAITPNRYDYICIWDILPSCLSITYK